MTAHTPTRTLKRAAAALSALLLVALCVAAASAAAQSGRRKPTQGVSKVPPAEGTAAPQGESESGPQPGAAKKPAAAVTFVVMEYDNAMSGIDFRARDGVRNQFTRRLEQSPSVAVTTAGRGNRKDARDRAKNESEAYVVLFQLEEEGYGSGPGADVDSRMVYLRTFTFAPKTGDLKYHDTVFQRPYRTSTKIGRIPIPTVNRYPSQHELEQAARDAADRLLSRFQIRAPSN